MPDTKTRGWQCLDQCGPHSETLAQRENKGKNNQKRTNQQQTARNISIVCSIYLLSCPSPPLLICRLQNAEALNYGSTYMLGQ